MKPRLSERNVSFSMSTGLALPMIFMMLTAVHAKGILNFPSRSQKYCALLRALSLF